MTTVENARQVYARREIAADPATIFSVLADASKHPLIDGSGTVRGDRGQTEPLHLGSKFSMGMKIGLPYVVSNTVVEFEHDHLIAWEHFGKHRWRYTLEPVDGGTQVTETFDWSGARSPWLIEKMGYPRKHPAAMEKTLERLDHLVTTGEAPRT